MEQLLPIIVRVISEPAVQKLAISALERLAKSTTSAVDDALVEQVKKAMGHSA